MSLPVAIGDYGLLCTSGFHRLVVGFCRSRQSWRRPNANQSATSNCNTHGPVTRRLHRQHLVHPQQFVGAWMWSKVGFASWNLLFSQMGPRGARSGSEPCPPPRPPRPPPGPGPPRRLAAQGGKGERCSVALYRLCRPSPLNTVCLVPCVGALCYYTRLVAPAARHSFMYNESLELTAPQHTAVKT
jgi:hypothetical protein